MIVVAAAEGRFLWLEVRRVATPGVVDRLGRRIGLAKKARGRNSCSGAGEAMGIDGVTKGGESGRIRYRAISEVYRGGLWRTRTS